MENPFDNSTKEQAGAEKRRKNEFTPEGVRILYEDNHLLVVEKPVNMPVQADASGDPDLLTLLKNYVRERYNKPGEAYLGLVHRLDRPVGGVTAFAKTSKAADRLTAQFRTHEARKRYCAIVHGEPASRAELTDWLVKDETTFTSRVASAKEEGAKEARLRYSLLGRSGKRALLDVELFTGRPHQIRVQLAGAGLPIEGDQRYAPDAQAGTQIRLWAYALTLTHPTLKEEMTFFSAPPWDGEGAFAAQAALLPAFAVCRGVYLDETRVVVDKNAGVETEGGLLGELESLFDEVYPVHRLDANTEGVVLFARTEDAAAKYEALFYRHELRKIYHAVVRGTPENGRLVHWVKKDAEEAHVAVCSAGEPGAQKCELACRVLKSDGEKSLVEIELFTGRTHQIRVQMAAAGHPVLGDDQYGDRAFNKAHHRKTQALLAKRLEIDGRAFESLRELEL